MTFEKNHKLGAKKLIDRPLDKAPISFKGFEGTRAKLREVPNWQERMREFVEGLIEEQEI